MMQDKTIERLVALVKQSVKPIQMDGQTWYDVANEGLEAEVKILRCGGHIAHHPLIHTLIRFGEDAQPFGHVTDCYGELD